MIDYLIRLAWKVIALVLAVAAVVLVLVIHRHHAGFERGLTLTVIGFRLAVLVVLVLVVIRIATAVTRFGIAPRAAKLNYWRMLCASWRWRWLTRNLGIAYPDPHNRKTVHRGAIGPALGPHTRIERPAARVRYPRARWRADEYGIIARVKVTPKGGRIDFENNAQRIADAWLCHRVGVSQPRPGRVILRGVLRDPLAEHFSVDAVPAVAFARDRYSPVVYLGRDEWADERWFNMAGVTGIAIGGLQDYGKTSLIRSLFCQDCTTAAVQYVVIDGKGGGDYLGQQDRLWLPIVGNDLERAAETLARCETLMNNRLAAAGRIPGPVNRWEVGPTEAYPRIVIVIDECHSFFDLEAVKGDKHREQLVRQCRSSAANMIRMGRSVLFCLAVITQKQTSDAVPTAIRDICQLSVSFATNESGAEAVLGDEIKRYPSYSPVALREKPTYIGVFTANIATGSDPFVRIRCPRVTDRYAAIVAQEHAHLRTDPEALLDQMLAATAELDNVYPFSAA